MLLYVFVEGEEVGVGAGVVGVEEVEVEVVVVDSYVKNQTDSAHQ